MKFDKGDILVPKAKQFPDGALFVDGHDEAGRLLAHPLGGGPQLVIAGDKLSTFRVVPETEQRGFLWRKGMFRLDAMEGEFAGWSCGMLWNGWEMPRFEREVAERVARAARGRYDEKRDCFLTPAEDGEEEWPADEIELLGGAKLKVYAIGAGSWIWEEV